MPWYPATSEIDRIQEAVDTAAAAWKADGSSGELQRMVSRTIAALPHVAADSPYVIRDWVWIAAQLRIIWHDQPSAAGLAWSGLMVLSDLIKSGISSSSRLEPTIRWLTDYVVDRLIREVGPDSFGHYLAADEATQVEDALLELADQAEPDVSTLVSHASSVADHFKALHHGSYQPSIVAKLECLCELAIDNGETGYWSRAALRYLHKERDLIPDSLGYMGLLDDIQVIEDIYEMVHRRMSWKPLIDYAVRHWPIVGRSYWMEGGMTNQLPPFFQAVAACVLNAAYNGSDERVMVLPDVGPAGIIAACILGLVETIGTDTAGEAPPGTVVMFRDRSKVHYALIEKPFENSPELPAIQLRDIKTVTSPWIMSLMEPARVENPMLAKFCEFERWKDSISTAGSRAPVWGYRRAGERPSALVICDKKAFMDGMDMIRPFGRSIEDLIPVTYLTRSGRALLGPDVKVAPTALIACNDPGTAGRILWDYRNNNDTPPRTVIIDRRIPPNQLEELRHRCRELGIRLIRFTTMSDTDVGASHNGADADVWFLRPGDIDPVPRSVSRSLAAVTGDGPLARYLRRQTRARDVEIKTVEVAAPAINVFADAARIVQRRSHTGDGRDLHASAVLSEFILRAISCAPPTSAGIQSPRLKSLIDHLLAVCGAYEMFDEDVGSLGRATALLKAELGCLSEKSRRLADILSGTSEFIHVVLGSRTAARIAGEAFSSPPQRHAKFVSVCDIGEEQECKVLVVPGWLGTLNMRLLQEGGWAPRLIKIFFAYESRRASWLNWRLSVERQRLSALTVRSWQRMAEGHPNLGAPPTPIEREVNPSSTDAPIDAIGPNVDNATVEDMGDEWIEIIVRQRVDALHRRLARTSDVTGQLVFFEDGNHYGIFAEKTSLICLNEFVAGGVQTLELSDSDVEKLLFRSVGELCAGDLLAFPDDPNIGDVIESIADGLLRDNGATRKIAQVWKNVLVDLARRCNWDIGVIQERLCAAGVERHPVTISRWLHRSGTIAPQSPTHDIPAILSLSCDAKIANRTKDVLLAVDKVYRARRDAARRLIMLLSTGEFSLDAAAKYVTVGEATVRYKLLTVSSIDEPATIDAGMLGLYTLEDQ